MYDIYMYRHPVEQAKKVLEERGITCPTYSAKRKGFLGLNQDFLDSSAIFYILQMAGLPCLSVPIKYGATDDIVTEEEAIRIGTKDLNSQISQMDPRYKFDAPILTSRGSIWYIVLVKANLLPKKLSHLKIRLYTHVDVLNGHIWTLGERERYFEPIEARLTSFRNGEATPQISNNG